MSAVVTVSHPLVESHLIRLRDATTEPPAFRQLVRRLAVLLAWEATRDLEVREVDVRTPLAPARGAVVRSRVALVPILRAGLGMVDPVLDLIPEAEVRHLGLYRDEATARPVEYYCKPPEGRPVDIALVLDPMLATGGSAAAALSTLRTWGVPRSKLLVIIASEEGIRRVREEHPEVSIYTCAVDPELDDRKFIVPGLGDAGDRIFHTVED